MESVELIKIFGCDKVKENGKSRNSDTKKGLYTFFDANILFLPKQSDSSLYELVTCNAVLDRFIKQVKQITNVEITKEELKNRFKFTEVSDRDFVSLCSDDNLPIIARNVLDNGESKNLWYEQVVPAETVFYTIIDSKGDATLANKIGDKDALVQIGANATIGYGYCKFTNL